jgi:hypothetical protein
MKRALSAVLTLGCILLSNSLFVSTAGAAGNVTCPPEVKSGQEFPLTDASGVTWHDSNSLNLNIDYKAVCSWKNVKASKRKEGNVCTYSDFGSCSVEGTPAQTKLYLTDYKPVIKAAATKH